MSALDATTSPNMSRHHDELRAHNHSNTWNDVQWFRDHGCFAGRTFGHIASCFMKVFCCYKDSPSHTIQNPFGLVATPDEDEDDITPDALILKCRQLKMD